MNSITESSYNKKILRRSKSLCSLTYEINKVVQRDPRFCSYDSHSRTASECSDVFATNESDSEDSIADRGRSGRGNVDTFETEVLGLLEQKIDGLNDLFQEQCKLLSEIKGEIEHSKDAIEKSGCMHNQLVVDIVNQMIKQRMKVWEDDSSEKTIRSRAKCLLDAIEIKQEYSLDKEIKEALTSFLQSEELKERVVSATAASVRDIIRECFTRDLSAVYLTALQRSQRNLVRQTARTLEDAFFKLEDNTAQMSRDVYRACRQLRRSLERHQSMLENTPSQNFVDSLKQTVEGLLDCELKAYRQKILQIISREVESKSEEWPESPVPSLEYPLLSPTSPPQPADPDHSVIDQLMIIALINKQIQEGDVNGSFERALSASDLSLVVAACRAVQPARAFGPPCPLSQAVLLSLVQQLATDMVHDTQLKCRYLEEAIISLNTSDPATRTHLPLVVGEVRKHLMKFLLSYPNHVANRRITLIVMAADNLLK